MQDYDYGLIGSRIRVSIGTKTNDVGRSDDLERPKRNCSKTFYGAHQKILNEYKAILSAAKCRPAVSRNIRFMRIFAGVARGERVNCQTPISVHA